MSTQGRRGTMLTPPIFRGRLVVDFLERHLKWSSPEVENPNLPA